MAKDNEVYFYCQVVQPCFGVKTNVKNGKKQYKKYNVGEKVLGKAYNASSIPSQYTPAIITKDRHVITQNNLLLLGEEQEAKIIDDNETASKKLREKFKSFYHADGINGVMTDTKKKSKFMVNGAIIGGVTILLYAMMKGQSKMNGFIVGAILGGLAGKYVADYRNKQD